MAQIGRVFSVNGFIALGALLVALNASGVLCGWMFGNEQMIGAVRGTVPMHPLTAIAFEAAAAALLPIAGKRSRFKTRIGICCAAIVVLVGAFRIALHLLGSGAGVDDILIPKSMLRISAGFVVPIQMAPATCLSFISIGIALLCLHLRRNRMHLLVYISILMPALAGTLTLSRFFFFNLATLEPVTQPFRMSVGTAASFLLLAASIAIELSTSCSLKKLTGNQQPGSPDNKRCFSLINWVAVVSGASVFMLCSVGIFSYQSISRFAGDSHWVDHTHQVLTAIDDLFAKFKNAEASESNYVITGDRHYLVPFNLVTDQIPGSLQTIKSLAVDNLSQQRGIALLEPLVQQKLALLQAIVQRRQDLGFEGARQELVSGHGDELMEGIRCRLADMSAEEHRLLADRTSETETNVARGIGIIAFGATLALAIASAAGWLLIRHIGARERAEEAVRASESLYRGLLQSAPDATVVISENGQIELFNDRAEQVFGYPAAELVGQPVDIIIPHLLHGGHIGKTGADFLLPVVLGLGEGKELFGVRKDASSFPIEINFSPLQTKDGLRISGAIRDVTQRKQREALLRADALQIAIFNSSNFWSVATDANGIIQIFNVGAERMLGYTAAEVVNKITPADISDPQEVIDHAVALSVELGTPIKPGFDALVYKASRGVEDIYELTYIRKDGTRFPAMVSVTALRDAQNALIGYLLIGTDNRAGKQAENARQLIEARFRQLMDSNAQGVFYWNVTGEITAANDAFLGFVGYTRADLAARQLRWQKMTPPEYAQLDQRALEQAAQTGVCTPYEKDLIRKDGSRIPVLVGAAVFKDNPHEGVGFVIDRTESERAVLEALRLATVVESSSDAVITANLDGIVTSWNAAAEKIYDYSAKEMVGHPIGLIVPSEYIHQEEWMLNQIKQGERIEHLETERLGKDGSRISISVTVSPIRDSHGRIIGASKVARDITESKRIARKLAIFNADLEQRVVERTAELEASNKELEAFSYSVSHDLRAPLRSIDGFSQVLLEDYSGKLDAEGEDHLRRIRAASQRMGLLIDDLINLSRVTRSEICMESVDLSKMALEIVQELRETAPGRDVEFIVAENLSANTDQRLMRIVLTNLLNNALKFTSKQSHGRIEFGSIGTNGSTEYFMRDNGAGFDPAFASKLFGAFQRLHAQKDFPGTGIGLATVQRIIHRQGGRIWADAELEKGATFHFTLLAAAA